MKEFTSSRLIILVAIFLMVFGNMAFFSNVTDVYPLNWKNAVFLGSLFVVFTSVMTLLLALVCHRHTIKPVLILILVLSSFAAYFMDSYNVILDDSMLDNAVNTNFAEAMDLFSFKLVLYVFLLGVLPSIFVYKVRLVHAGSRAALFSSLKLVVASAAIILAVIFMLGNFYSSFLREHKSLRFYSNPGYYIYSLGQYVGGLFAGPKPDLVLIGQDSEIPPSDVERELVVFVVGEAARADKFSLNGYTRETNPGLKSRNVISFSNVSSCGTSTAVSVPCIFSHNARDTYDVKKARYIENVLDVIQHAGVNVLWLDNNSDSKGVALRETYEDYKMPENNPVCDTECRDVGMLTNLQAYVDEHKKGDIFIVLHQMGNHGPAYYKRYPPEFEKFKPVCKTNQLEQCSKEEIDNAYDNAILYTDYFLSKTIDFLQKNSGEFETAMLYASDHGESLGENGIYLHGLPYFLAPEEQTHIPMILWLGDSFETGEVDIEGLRRSAAEKFSHDNIFHTILGLLEVETSEYDKSLDLLGAYRHEDPDMQEK